MRTTLLRLAVALATFGVGVTLTTLWIASGTPRSVPGHFHMRAVPAPPAPPVPPAPPAPLAEPCEASAGSANGWAARGDSANAPISGGVLNGKAISKPAPAYPAVARQAHVMGTVVVLVTLDECGHVESARVVSGHPLLRGASLDAAYRARFSPTRLSGRPVKVSGTISYNFMIE